MADVVIMSVGNPTTSAMVDAQLTQLSTQLRNAMQAIANLSLTITGQGTGLAVLEALGFGSAANPANPAGVSDAQLALNMINYLNTVAGVYFGTAAQASAFNFHQELSQLWAGQ